MRDRGEGVSMNPTLKLLKIVGSPFASRQKRYLPESRSEALELHTYATKNKIGLLYLEALKEQGKLEEFELKRRYEEEKKKHDEQLITASRISKLFNSFGVNYAIFKSIMPFPAVPNDVDIIHLGSDKEYKKAVEIMLRSGYTEVKGPVDEGSQLMFHDARDGILEPHPHEKDVYDIDLYQKIAASYVLYLDKRKFEKTVTEMDIMGAKIKVLRQEAELVAIIIHSIIPEQLLTGLAYYATLHHLIDESFNLNDFIHITKENNVTFSVKAHCSLVAELHRAAYGFVPEKVEEILIKLGDEQKERKILAKNDFQMPHKYSLSAVLRILLEKMRERGFRRSVLKQMVFMLNPRLAKWVIWNVIWRRRRETY